MKTVRRISGRIPNGQHDHADDDQAQCGDRADVWVCTRVDGHESPHVAGYALESLEGHAWVMCAEWPL